MIYSNQFAIGNKPIGIASLAAVLKKAGHQFRLFDCTKYSVLKPNEEFTDWNLSGEEILQFISPVAGIRHISAGNRVCIKSSTNQYDLTPSGLSFKNYLKMFK